MVTTVYLNGRFLTQRVTGVQRYAAEVLASLDSLLSKVSLDDVALILTAPLDACKPELRVIEFQRVGPFSGHVWEQLTYPWVARDGLMWSFAATGPLVSRAQAVTIHDATVKAHPESFSPKFRAAYGLAMPWLARRAAQVMTVSEFSRREIARHYDVDLGALRVSGEGWEHAARVPADPAILARHGLTNQCYILAVSSLTPHKNFGVVLRALAELRDTNVRLVIAGALNDDVFGAVDPRSLEGAARVGYVTDGELRALYEHAGLFVFPSLYEGFGLPLVEAMSYGCPVIASRAAAMPEVCGDAALYFEPHAAHELASLIRMVLCDPSKRAELIARGKARLAQHSWQRAAEVHLGAIRETAAHWKQGKAR